MKKGIDSKFLHFGIRQEDLNIIEAICEKNELDFSWLSEEILKVYDARKVDVIEMDEAETENIIRTAIQNINQ